MRILIDVTEQQLDALAALAKRRAEPRAAIVRQAIDEHVKANQRPLSDYFGLWAKNGHAVDAQECQSALRAEWDREWDR